MKKCDHNTQHSESFETQATNLEKLAYVFFRYVHLPKKKRQVNPRLSILNSGVKKIKTDVRKPAKSLRTYIKQKFNKFLIMFFVYLFTFILILILGGLLSKPMVFNHYRVKSNNQTEKDRFITRINNQKKF